MVASLSLRAALFGLALLAARRPSEPPRVTVYAACEPTSARMGDVLEILAAELAPAPVRGVAERPEEVGLQGVLIVIDGCTDEPPEVRTSVFSAGKWLTRILDLSDVIQTARARTLAIALGETVRLRSDPEELPPSAAEIVPPPPPPPLSPPSPFSEHSIAQRRPAAHTFAAGAFRLALDTTTPLVGSQVGARIQRFSFGLLALGSERGTPLGVVWLVAAAPTASFDLLCFPSGAVFGRGELGIAVAAGSPRGATTGRAGGVLHAAFALGLRAEIPLGGHSALEMALDGGLASSATARVASRDEASLGKWFTTAMLGAQFP